MAYDQNILNQLQAAGRNGTYKQDGKIYQGMWTGSSGGGEDSQGSDYLTGYYSYDDYTGPDGNGKPVYGQTPFQGFDMQGNQTTSGVMKKDNPTQMLLMALAAAGGMSFGLPALMGGQGAGAGVAGSAFGDAGLMYGGADAAAAGSLGGAAGGAGAGFGAGAGLEGLGTGLYDVGLGNIADAGIVGSAATAPSVSVPWIPGGVGQVGGAIPSVGAATGGMGIGSSFLGSGGTGVAPAPGGGFMNTVGSALDHPAVRGASLATTVNSLLNPKQGEAGISGTDLASIIAGVMDYRGNKGSSNDMLNYMREQQGKIDALYAPGSPEWNSLWQAMERKDAAAGRNSQYGTRAVDFLGKIADTKAKYTSELTRGLAGNYQDAFDRDHLSSGAALSGALKGLLRNPENLSSIVSKIGNVATAAGDSFEDFVGGLFD